MARLANSLGNELVKAETAKAARSQNPNAIDFTLRGEAFHVVAAIVCRAILSASRVWMPTTHFDRLISTETKMSPQVG